MRIIANKILTDLELARTNTPIEQVVGWVKTDLAGVVQLKLLEMPSLFYEERKEERHGTEYRIELFVLSKETFNNIILTLQETDVRKTTRERIRDILMSLI
jgi:hypothetical protein